MHDQRGPASTATIVVLTNVRDVADNPYARLWADAARRAGALLLPLTKSAVLARGSAKPGWVHVQWPEWSLSGDTPQIAGFNALKFLALLGVARARGARVMVTAHNVWSHDRRFPRLEHLMWSALGWLTTDLHMLSRAGASEFLAEHPTFRRSRIRNIPHGNYDPEVGNRPTREQARCAFDLPRDARIFLSFGALKRYKGVEDVVRAFSRLRDGDARLVIAGRVIDEGILTELESARSQDRRIILLTRFLPGDDMNTLVRAADGVVLPYRRVLNSGSALLALTLARPVLLPATPTFAELRSRVGAGWVALFDDEIGPGQLASMPQRSETESPDLSWCSWETITEQLRALWFAADGVS